MAGASGFAGEEELDLMLGSVLGIRQWSRGLDGRLQGVHSFLWSAGENVAVCGKPHRPPYSVNQSEVVALNKRRDSLRALTQRMQNQRPKGIADLPADQRAQYERACAQMKEVNDRLLSGELSDCGCGFWAYWNLNPSEYRMGDKPVVGVVKGYGKVLLGSRGFRSEKAKILGLHLAYEYVKPKPKSRVPAVPDREVSWSEKFASDYEVNSQEAVARIAADEAELEALYPGVRVFSTLDALLETFPPTREYSKSEH